jgi:cytochrome c-type biogenesis protein CcmH
LRDAGARGAWAGRAAVLLLAVLSVAAGPIPPDTDAVQFEKATRTILCDCGCHPQSVYDCACGRAAQLRDEIAGMIRDGRTGDDVIEAFVARQGEQVRVAPLARGFNLVAWLGPAFLFLGAAVAMVLVLRRWRRSAPAASDAAAPVPAIDPDDPHLARLREEMERFP